MKDNFERILKEQLDNYEMPYDQGAWEQFSKRLDGTPSTPFYRKWWFAAAAGTVLVGSATYFALSSNQVKEADASPVNQTVATQIVTGKQSPSGSANTVAKATSDNIAEDHAAAAPVHSQHGSAMETNASRSKGDETQDINFLSIQKELDRISTPLPHQNTGNSGPAYIRFDAPASVCLNETFSIKNPNEGPLWVTLPNGKARTVAPRQVAEFKASEAGKITVQSANQTEIITVNEAASNLLIDVDASLLYEEGIPTMHFKVLNAEHPVSWTSNIDQSARSVTKNELTVHPYTERQVTVIAASTDQNGCAVSEKKTISISQPYNLLAPTGFDPSSSDKRISTFMPAALVIRDTPFEMVIMDSKTMAVVYRTTDAAQGWDGMDSRTGQVSSPGSTWLWKVVLKSPQPGEKSEYNGVVTRVDW